MSLPWKALLVDGYDNAPWLTLLPAEANNSVYGHGRYLLSQTAACKRGTLSPEQYGPWVRDLTASCNRTSAADTLIKCCAAFAYTPFSAPLDLRAAIQCIDFTMRRVLGTDKGRFILPSLLEGAMEFVCPAGCGHCVSEEVVEHEQYYALEDFGHTLKYCSKQCAHTVSSRRSAFADTHTRARPPPRERCTYAFVSPAYVLA